MEQINRRKIQQVTQTLEADIIEYYRLSYALYSDQIFLYQLESEAMIDRYDAKRRFQELLSTRNVRSNISLYVHKNQMVYSNNGVSSDQAYFSKHLQIDQREQGNLLQAMQEMPVTAAVSFLPIYSEQGQWSLVLFYRAPSFTPNPTATMLAVLSEDHVQDMFSNWMQETPSIGFLLDALGNVMYQSASNPMPEKGPSQQELLQQGLAELSPNTLGEPVFFTAENGENYTVFTHSAYNQSVIAGTIIKESDYLSGLAQQRTTLWRIVIFSLPFSFLAVLFFAFASYRPLERLVALTGQQEEGANEFQWLHNSIVDSAEKIYTLEAVVEAQKPIILERMLHYALYSEATCEQVYYLFESLEMEFDHDNFFVMSLRLREHQDRFGDSQFKTMVIEAVQQLGNKHIQAFPLERPEEAGITIAVNCDATVTRQEIAKTLQHLLRDSEYLFSLGVGGLYHTVDDLKNSLYEAHALVENTNQSAVAFSEDMGHMTENMELLYPSKDLVVFLQQLRLGDHRASQASFERFYQQVTQTLPLSLSAQHTISHFIHSVSEVVLELSGDEFIAPVYQLMAYTNPEDFYQTTTALLAEFCGYIKEGKKSANEQLWENIFHYVNTHITDPDLGLKSIAEEFGVSPYYVSRFFRDQHSINLKDYMTDARLEIAKQKLVHTEDTVTDIVEEIGYLSTSSFIRKFKAETGLTPGQYREKHAGSDQSLPLR